MTALRGKGVESSDIRLAGNWYPFPPPEPGTYDLRQSFKIGDLVQFVLLENKRVYEGKNGRFMCMGHRITGMRPEDGWQFRFHQELVKGTPVNWRPFAVIYNMPLTEGPPPAALQVVEKRDISQQLPLARSRVEALYIVRQIPTRWPVFRKIHVEYTEEKLQS
jgi:hypothetical protein